MASRIGARKSAEFKAISTAPSFNKTPVGNSTPPLPYPTTADLSNSVGVVRSVRFNGCPAYVLDQTTQTDCKGDNAGTCGGVKSGTVNGEVKPVKGSRSVRVGGKYAIREGDPCTMNGGNNPGIYVTTPSPNGLSPRFAGQTPIIATPQTTEEEHFFAQAYEALEGAAQGAATSALDGLEGTEAGKCSPTTTKSSDPPSTNHSAIAKRGAAETA